MKTSIEKNEEQQGRLVLRKQRIIGKIIIEKTKEQQGRLVLRKQRIVRKKGKLVLRKLENSREDQY